MPVLPHSILYNNPERFTGGVYSVVLLPICKKGYNRILQNFMNINYEFVSLLLSCVLLVEFSISIYSNG